MNTRYRRTVEAGAALLVTMDVIVLLTALAAAFLVVSHSENQEHVSAETKLQGFYIAEAGLSDALADLSGGGSGMIASAEAPRPFSAGSYYVTTANLGNGRWRAISVSEIDGQQVAIEGTIMDDVASAYYRSAMFGGGNILFRGTPVIDSYDSALGVYSAQASNALHGRSFASGRGDVESNGDIIFESGATAIFGRAIPGPGKLLSVTGGNYVLGSTAPRLAPKPMPAVIIPAGMPDLPTTKIDLSSGVTTVPPGTHHYSELKLKKTARLDVQGPATLLVDKDFTVDDTANFCAVSDNGPVYIYCTGEVKLQRSALVGSSRQLSWDLMIFSTTDNSTGFDLLSDGDPAKKLTFEDQSTIFGVVNAPRSTVTITKKSQVYGSVCAERLRMRNNATIHFDEMLGRRKLDQGKGEFASSWTGSGASAGAGSSGSGPGNLLKLTSWRRVAPGSVDAAAPPPTEPPLLLPGKPKKPKQP